MQRKRAMTLSFSSLETVTSQTWVVRPRCAGFARPKTAPPSRTVPRKFDLSSIVVNPTPSGVWYPVPTAQSQSASV